VPDETSATQRTQALEARLVDLEVRLSFQQQTIEELDLVLREFTDRVQRLEAELREFRSLSADASALAEPSRDDFEIP